MADATRTARRLCATPEAAVTFIEAAIDGKQRTVDELKTTLSTLKDRPDADPTRLRAIEQTVLGMTHEVRTERDALVSFREDFAFP